jgi:ABC-type transporter Mla subunit MlaD
MKTITQLKDDLKALMKASADIDAKATSENRGLSDNEKNLKHELLDKVEEINTEIKVRERELRIADALASPEDAVTVPKGADVRAKTTKAEKGLTALASNSERLSTPENRMVMLIQGFTMQPPALMRQLVPMADFSFSRILPRSFMKTCSATA